MDTTEFICFILWIECGAQTELSLEIKSSGTHLNPSWVQRECLISLPRGSWLSCANGAKWFPESTLSRKWSVLPKDFENIPHLISRVKDPRREHTYTHQACRYTQETPRWATQVGLLLYTVWSACWTLIWTLTNITQKALLEHRISGRSPGWSPRTSFDSSLPREPWNGLWHLITTNS